eukprot:TRINITY_DN6706_c0_g1_i1.p1 TRINITY_DN6706_c0_g1~~TRINITY_DN6706_c0_g1_i1.p1  ORF type:complete len:154 (-),score=31.42 TRINITY_DN6706_c0_g1_i1:212-673(-)
MPKSVLFVCLGNYCRSPMAEEVFRDIVQKRGLTEEWIVDSAATGSWHVGESPDSRCVSTLQRHGISTKHLGRQITTQDFQDFDFVLCMDDNNMKDLRRVCPKEHLHKLQFTGSYDPKKIKIVEDPYYGTTADFESVYHQLVRCVEGFLQAHGH